ncbi:leucine-rich repeat-containing protein 20 isoform X2 [Chrysemys picta bellii]|uniref:leucine-rich repeat-containing protein 20 isoform X2 n=1 Tax=Chrysemys picta bellii TaxID=8478 RepID=UPI001C670025|nr:leucine-rich repeat-containing protein 20 isoform X2 [Chrysemys picta bellii]
MGAGGIKFPLWKCFPGGTGCGACMEKKMGEAVARVARKVNETVENGAESLDLADCKLMMFPIGIYKVMRNVTEGIHLITLANNELKSVTSKFITTFSQMRELNLEGNYLRRLPEEMRTLLHLKVINLSRNKFRHFPEQLTTLKALETINLEENEITGLTVSYCVNMQFGKMLVDDSITSLKGKKSVFRHGCRTPIVIPKNCMCIYCGEIIGLNYSAVADLPLHLLYCLFY